MGLDIQVRFDLGDKFYDLPQEIDYNQFLNDHWLSREFCIFMCRRDVISGKAELDQIGELTETDITPIYDMNNYLPERQINLDIDSIAFIAGKTPDQTRAEILESNKKYEGNIDLVIETLEKLIDKLSKINDLSAKIKDQNWHGYFDNFNAENMGSYTKNNFGQDLRNLLRYVKYGKEQGAKTVGFHYE